jgi:hypothetical protein
MVSLYGAPFMPPPEKIEELMKRGVRIQILLMDPSSQALADLAQAEVRCQSVTHASLVRDGLRDSQESAGIFVQKVAVS